TPPWSNPSRATSLFSTSTLDQNFPQAGQPVACPYRIARKTTAEQRPKGRAQSPANTRLPAHAPAARITPQRIRLLMPRNSPRDCSDSSDRDRLSGSSLPAPEAGTTNRSPQREQTTGLPAFSPGTLNDLPHCVQEKRI